MTDAEVKTSSVVQGAVTAALHREDVPIDNKDVAVAAPKVAAAVVNAINDSDKVAMVPVDSPWTSKINITQAVTAVITFLVAFGIPISDDQKVSILTLTGLFGPMLTAIFRTFFTRSISRLSK